MRKTLKLLYYEGVRKYKKNLFELLSLKNFFQYPSTIFCLYIDETIINSHIQVRELGFKQQSQHPT
jgi:hypothetical protein